jgi:hypothetical protein
MVDKNLEALRGADADKERTERVVGEVTLEVCSAEESFGNEPTETERKLERKPYNTSSGRNWRWKWKSEICCQATVKKMNVRGRKENRQKTFRDART